MTLLLASIGWGLLAVGAVTHVWHQQRLRELLAAHVDHERGLALALTAVELAAAIALPLAYFLDATAALVPAAVVAGVLGVGFTIWVSRLLLLRSELPCACSFADAPTSVWSLLRSASTVAAVLYVVADPASGQVSTALATSAVGLAAATTIFVLPEALSWPEASRATLARLDAHGSPAARS